MQQILASSSDRSRIFYLFLFLFAGLFLAGGLMEILSSMPGLNDKTTVWYIRLSAFVQSLMMFFLPAFTIAAWSDAKPLRFLKMEKKDRLFVPVLLSILLFVVSTPLISLLTQWNKQMHLPEAMSALESWMRNTEDVAAASTNIILQDKSLLGFSLNLLLIAAFTAVSEEFFFRGILQRSLQGVLKNGHAAVWAAAFVFSAFHLQFYGFLPRLVLGAVLGYLFLYSQNLWVPIAAHFFNNALVIVITFIANPDFVKKINEPELNLQLISAATVSLILSVFLLYRLKIYKSPKPLTQNSNIP